MKVFRCDGIATVLLVAALGCGSTATNPRIKRDTGSGGSGGSGGRVGGTGGDGGAGGVDAAVAPPVDAARDAAIDRAPREAGPDLPPALPSGLVGYWRFDELGATTAPDLSGSLNDGSLMTGATIVTGGFPTAMFPNPGALNLDGVMSRVVLGANRLPNVDGPKTIALWFNYTAVPTTTRDFVSLTNGAALCGLQIGVRSSQLGVWGWGGTVAQLLSAPPAAAGWHQLTYTFDGNIHSLSIDGAPPITSTTGPQVCDVTDAVVGSYAGGRENFAGLIDDLRIYTRALSAGEIATLAAGGEPTPLGGRDAGADRAVDAPAEAGPRDAGPPDAAVDVAPPVDASPDAAPDTADALADAGG